ncbi:pilus assembly protein TadG [Sphingobium sp. SCG-1]|uniref:TadE/TadG family type IV pilus assembly protein n=1 Tax=Sphingobium sp. SCG-1 TaxID=2072936 RepID=UPI000CD6756D|nr:TadE/TadG family type IV pilus assembly protein [Sphingobium sp. SCG-1]AUW59121.1 pilus assembly protein TadG [Sphingobium sp. SCG-1]
MSNWAGNTIGFLGRLRKDVRGNVIAMSAAAIFPLIGLLGGAVDMGRLYAVKTRLQSACDAGALAGRRVMGTGRWTDNSGRANQIATQTFDLNFPAGSFGSGAITRTFSEVDGTVTGNASVPVPMTLMRLFGSPEKTLTVTCDGLMLIPNTDVMFVLDNSGSMNQVIPDDATGLTKIAGLRRAIKCFYEALARQDITDVTPANCGTTANPTGGLSSQVQLRFGFVNYDHMVNVGKLLPNDYLVDNWTYQSREPIRTTVWSWTLGSESSANWGNWPSKPTELGTASNYSNWTSLAGTDSLTINGKSYTRSPSAPKSITSCSDLNKTNGGVEYTDAGSVQTEYLQSTTQSPPVHPAASQALTYDQKDNHVATAYRYFWTNGKGNSGSCNLQSGTYNYTLTRTTVTNKPIIWAQQEQVTWRYKPVSFPLASLKAGGSTWAGSVLLPIGQGTGATVKLSGSNADTTLTTVADTSVTWNGCIEERQTFKNTDGDPSDDWTGYPLSPAAAFDMDIDTPPTPGNAATQWRPALHSAVWGRKTTQSDSGWSGSNTTNEVDGGNATDRNLSSNNCVTASRKLTSYSGQNGNLTASNFRAYVNTIAPNGNTYHDIGLLWGARLMSPTGIFASENAMTAGGAQIQRHMIFMTDGDTANTWNNYASYGLEWWDRRQINPIGLSNGSYETKLEDNNNARSNALCTAIKNKNITLWVISYGDGVNTTTQTRLENCATSPTYFFSAANTTTLIAKFREIADKISNLRLTK